MLSTINSYLDTFLTTQWDMEHLSKCHIYYFHTCHMHEQSKTHAQYLSSLSSHQLFHISPSVSPDDIRPYTNLSPRLFRRINVSLPVQIKICPSASSPHVPSA